MGNLKTQKKQVAKKPISKAQATRALSISEKKQVLNTMKAAKKMKKYPESAQQTISYQSMEKDGVCMLSDGVYSRTREFKDVNYQLAKPDDKNNIFERYCDFLNYFDNSIGVQLTFINQRIDINVLKNALRVEKQNDGCNELRDEYINFLRSQLDKGKNEIQRRKYITYTIHADDSKLARQKLDRVDAEVTANFKSMDCASRRCDGYERLKQLHDIMNREGNQPFRFSWDLIVKTGLTTKNFVVPSSFDFRQKSSFVMGQKTMAQCSYIEILAPEIEDTFLSDILDTDGEKIVTLHIQSIEQVSAIKQIRQKITQLNEQKIEENKKAYKGNYGSDILPPELQSSLDEAYNLLSDLQGRNERMFLVTLLVMNMADNEKDFTDQHFQINSICQKYNCRLIPLDFEQEAGLISSLPLGVNKLEHVERQLTTTAAAIFVPFTTQELYQNDGTFFGLNALNNKMIMASRGKLKNPNGLILGTPGSGKSFLTKLIEIIDIFFRTLDEIAILDPEGEYKLLVKALGGQVIEISQQGKFHLNPMDIDFDYGEGEDPIDAKCDFILTMLDVFIGGKDGLSPIERSIIDRAARQVFRVYLADIEHNEQPILEDLWNAIKAQTNREAESIAVALEIYVKGSQNFFNHRTNVDIQNRLMCYDTKGLGKQLKKAGMIIVQDQLWGRVARNRDKGIITHIPIDEFHLLLKDADTASFSVEIFKRLRKWGGWPTGITQNVKDLLKSEEIQNIFDCSDFIALLNQSPGDREILARLLNISDSQLSYITNANEGSGLLIYGSVILPFVYEFPKDLDIYRLITTKPEEQQSYVDKALAEQKQSQVQEGENDLDGRAQE